MSHLTEAVERHSVSEYPEPTRAAPDRFAHVLRFVTAFALRTVTVAGCTGGGLPHCRCREDGAIVMTNAAVCSSAQLDAGCYVHYPTAGPLRPPELSASLTAQRALGAARGARRTAHQKPPSSRRHSAHSEGIGNLGQYAQFHPAGSAAGQRDRLPSHSTRLPTQRQPNNSDRVGAGHHEPRGPC